MGELDKKWFQIVWFCLLLASLSMTYMQRWIEASWVHSPAMEILDSVLMWITFSLSVVLFVRLCIGYWRKSERLFWRMLRRWSGALAIGVIAAVVLVLLVRNAKGGSATISDEHRAWFICIFAAAGLLWMMARYKFKHWHKDE